MDTSPTSLFEAYEQDFQQLIASIRDKIGDHASDEGGGKYFRHNKQNNGPHRRDRTEKDRPQES